MQTQYELDVSLPQNSTTVRSATFVPRPVVAPEAVRWFMRHSSALAPEMTAHLAHNLFFKPPRTRAKAEQQAILTRGEPFTVCAQGATVRGYTFAARPTVLLVHGWGGNAGQMSAFVEPLLARGYGVAVIDMPGHGRSGGRLSSLVHFADAIRAVNERCDGLHAIIAHSFGAAAVTLALRDGLPLSRTAFIASPARFDSFWSRFTAGVGVSEQAFARMVANAERWLGLSFAEAHPEVVAPSMSTPLLLVHDANDREIDIAEGELLSRRWPGAEMVTTSGLGHVRILQDASTVERVVDWISAPR